MKKKPKRKTLRERASDLAYAKWYTQDTQMAYARGWLSGYRAAQRDARRRGR